MPDININSFLGPDDNGRTVMLGDVLPPANAAELASAIKCTRLVRDLTLYGGTVYGFRDAVVDVNDRAYNLAVHLEQWWPSATGQFAATVKGGASRVVLQGRLMRHARKYDVIIGDWSDQSHDPTTLVSLGLVPDDGQPVTVCVLKGTKPIELPGTGPYRYCFPNPDACYHDLAVFGFETLRRWGAFRSASNNPS